MRRAGAFAFVFVTFVGAGFVGAAFGLPRTFFAGILFSAAESGVGIPNWSSSESESTSPESVACCLTFGIVVASRSLSECLNRYGD